MITPSLLLAAIASPFVRLLSASTRLMLRIFGVKDEGRQAMTDEELHLMLEEGSDAGIIEHHEHQMVRNVFRLDDRQISSFMVPRSEVVYFDLDQPVEENLKRFEAAGHSRLPVLNGGWNNILGVANARGHVLHLREGYIEAAGDPRAVARLVDAAVGPFRALVTNVARLDGISPKALVTQLNLENFETAFPGALRAAEQIVDYVDAWKH